MKKLFLIPILALFVVSASAQQEALYTHYMFNTLEMNPAYAGSRGCMSFVALHRSQWAGFDGAPTTQSFGMNSPILNGKLGVGLNYNGDRIGPIRSSMFSLAGAYIAKLNENTTMSLGINGGFQSVNANLSDLNLYEVNDASFLGNAASKLTPNFGAGIYLQNQKWYFGLSSPRILETKFLSAQDNGLELLQSKRHYYATAGAILSMTKQIMFKPSVLMKTVPGAPVQLDATAMFVFNDKFWTGVSSRSGDALGALIGFNFNENLQVGYAYDWSYAFGQHAGRSGSHEVVLRYELTYKQVAKIKSPRYF
jgi:type IX secretion system PorP/SprF family membrane protein